MAETAKVLLLTGPTGSGKSTLGRNVSKRLGWKFISEDNYWVKSGWSTELRTPEREKEIQRLVGQDLLDLSREGKSAVLEFVLYKDPPNPLTAYQELLDENAIDFAIVALKPTADEIMRRVEQRGRTSDLANLEGSRLDAENQLGRLAAEHINPEWIIDPTGVPIDSLTDRIVDMIGPTGG